MLISDEDRGTIKKRKGTIWSLGLSLSIFGDKIIEVSVYLSL